MNDCMTFPDTVEEFMEQYKVVDTDGIYMSKGAELVPIFRMRQWFEHLPSSQSDVPDTNVGDMISRRAAIDTLGNEGLITAMIVIDRLPSAQPDVIRCRDCKHFGGGTYCYERDDMWDENDFCSYAERKGEEDENE